MAFSSTRKMRASQAFRVSAGTFTQAAGDVGGTIDTGIKNILYASISASGQVETTLPKITWSGAVLTIITTDDFDGYWFAIGR